MDIEAFERSLGGDAPPSGLDAPLQALWHEAAGDWEQAHRVVQADSSRSAAWVHAYLHRKEGDQSNAGYWYARAGKPVSGAHIDDEWHQIVLALLKPGES